MSSIPTLTDRPVRATCAGGLFIAVEGQNGSGKGSLIEPLAEALRLRTTRDVVVVREPGGTAFGEQMRKVLLAPDREHIDGITALCAFSASRRELIMRRVVPALEQGAIVLADRFVLSTYVYQGAQGVAPEDVDAVSRVVIGSHWPALTLVLTVPPDVQLARVGGRGAESEQFEAAELAAGGFAQRYAEAARRVPNCVLLDASGTPDEVLERAWHALEDQLGPQLDALLTSRTLGAGVAPVPPLRTRPLRPATTR